MKGNVSIRRHLDSRYSLTPPLLSRSERRLTDSSLMKTIFPLAIWLACSLAGSTLVAQDSGYYFPLDHRQPQGTAGRWAVTIDRCLENAPQHVVVVLPSTGSVTFVGVEGPSEVSAPAQAAMYVGHVYRIRIAGMPEFPGVELFPTIEVIDRLHPPEGLAEQYPIPVEITAEEIAAALDNQLVTKVIYLEQPDLSAPIAQGATVRVEDLHPTLNLMEAADMNGRPMAIFRLGGRRFDGHDFLNANDSTAPIAGLPVLSRP
jgi:hypothetical protein